MIISIHRTSATKLQVIIIIKIIIIMEAFMRLVHFSIKQHKKKFFLNATKTDKDLSIQKM